MGPFLATFFITMFFFIMQFFWKYVDDLMGKGLDFLIIGELLFYASFTLVSMALPLAIMLSSIMVFGALGESNELTAMKSAGMSLFRIMKPLTYLVIFISIGAFFFANYTWPWSNLKWKTLYYEILESKPAFQMSEKVFYNEIPNYTIRVDKKELDGKHFRGISIFDYSGNFYYRKRDVKADEGEIIKSKNPDFMVLNLKTGVIYEEAEAGKMKGEYYPFKTTEFQEASLKFDVSSLRLSRGNEDLFKDSYEMLDIFQLNIVIDSLNKTLLSREAEYIQSILYRHSYFKPRFKQAQREINSNFKNLPIVTEKKTVPQPNLSIERTPEQLYTNKTINTALMLCNDDIAGLNGLMAEKEIREDALRRYNIEWHRKFTLSLACIVIFFIGAPLGAIVKRGGLGMPMVVSVVLFLIYHILTTTGEKMAKAGTVSVPVGMWYGAISLSILGILLTWMAAREFSPSDLFDKLNFKKKKRIL